MNTFIPSSIKLINVLVFCKEWSTIMLPLQARLTLHSSLVLPLIEFGDIVWGDKNNSTLMDLQILQNKAAKIIIDHHPRSSATEALDSLAWKPLHLRRRFHRCITTFKRLNGFTDFSCHLITNSLVHTCNTRHKNDLHLPRVRTNWDKQHVFYHGVTDWNVLSQETGDTSSQCYFKANLKREL